MSDIETWSVDRVLQTANFDGKKYAENMLL